MREIEKYFDRKLKYENIYFSDYFRSLSSEGKRCGLLDEKTFDGLKNGVRDLVAGLISDYTGHESTSVMRSTANEIFESLLYGMDIFLFSFESHEGALDEICRSDVSGLYGAGQRMIRQLIFESVSLLVKTKNSRINFQDRSYNKSVDTEVMSFLKRYDPVYFAGFTKKFFSYETVNGCGGYRGILRLKKYLQNMIAENTFVSGFDESEIQGLCYGYCESNGREYNDVGANIYSIALMNRITAFLCGKNGIEVDREKGTKFLRDLKKMNGNEIKKIICDAVGEISEDEYVKRSTERLAGRLADVSSKNELKKMIYIGEIR